MILIKKLIKKKLKRKILNVQHFNVRPHCAAKARSLRLSFFISTILHLKFFYLRKFVEDVVFDRGIGKGLCLF